MSKKTTGRRGNNEGSIYQRKDGRWCCQVIIGYTPEGKPTRKYVYWKSRQEVAQKLTLYNHNIIEHGYSVETKIKEKIKLNPALKEWIVVFLLCRCSVKYGREPFCTSSPHRIGLKQSSFRCQFEKCEK